MPPTMATAIFHRQNRPKFAPLNFVVNFVARLCRFGPSNRTIGFRPTPLNLNPNLNLHRCGALRKKIKIRIKIKNPALFFLASAFLMFAMLAVSASESPAARLQRIYREARAHFKESPSDSDAAWQF